MTNPPSFRVTFGRYAHDYATLSDALAYVVQQIERDYWNLYPTLGHCTITLQDARTGEVAAAYGVEEIGTP